MSLYPLETMPPRPRSTLLAVLALWLAFYASFTLFTPPLLDDADSVHAEVAREMIERGDYVTLYANGIRYLEKAPLMYWSMAGCMRVSQLFGATSPRALAAAARVPIALSVLLLVLVAEALARRMFRSQRAGLYAALILLSSPGIFLFSRLILPDVMLCAFTTMALYCFWRTEELGTPEHHTPGDRRLRLMSGGFAASCALNVLTKGLIGVVFPLGVTLLYLALTRGLRGAWKRLGELHPLATCEAFLLIAAPWHVLAGLANPGHGHPAAFQFVHGHWIVPLPTDGNVRGWFWFYFMNEHLLRYLNLRVPHDYDTSPLWLFWGLCLVWVFPWTAFVFRRVADAVRQRMFLYQLQRKGAVRLPSGRKPQPDRVQTLLLVWAAFVLLFFALSSRQEYYVLPAMPAFALLIAGWLAADARFTFAPNVADEVRAAVLGGEKAYGSVSYTGDAPVHPDPTWRRVSGNNAQAASIGLVVIGTLVAAATTVFLLHSKAPAPGTDLSMLLQQHPSDYALSMGHFMDLTGAAVGMFRLPLAIIAISLFTAPLAALLLRRRDKPHAANLALAAGAFGFLLTIFLGLRTFSPVLTSAQLAETIAPQVKAGDLVVIHGEYEAGSTLGFYLQRPVSYAPLANDAQFIHILEGRSSNLWYGSFFPDAPGIFESPQSLAVAWSGPQRVFLWQSLTDPPNQLPVLPGPVFVLAHGGGKEIVSNQPNR